jgi:hypothetical protein
MNGLQKTAGIASIVQAAGYVVILLFALVLLPIYGIKPGDLNSPDKVLPVVTSPVLKEYYSLFLVFGLTIVVTLGVYDRLQGDPPALMQVAVAASLASAIFWVGYSMFGSAMVSTLKSLNAQNPTLSQGSFVSATIVINGLLNSAPFAGSWSLILWGWAALQTRKLPVLLGTIVLAAGLIRLLMLLVPSRLGTQLNLVQVLLSILWGIWLGFILLRDER